MAELIKDKSEKVRRKAMAALGEYLFYGATQIDEDASNVNHLCIINLPRAFGIFQAQLLP
jgi:hypothetical protein